MVLLQTLEFNETLHLLFFTLANNLVLLESSTTTIFD